MTNPINPIIPGLGQPIVQEPEATDASKLRDEQADAKAILEGTLAEQAPDAILDTPEASEELQTPSTPTIEEMQATVALATPPVAQLEPDERDDEIARLRSLLTASDARLSVYDENEQEAERVRDRMAKIKFYQLRKGAHLNVIVPLDKNGIKVIEFKFLNGSLRLQDPDHVKLFESELRTNPVLRQAVYQTAEQAQQDIADAHAKKALAEKAIAVGAAGTNMEQSPAQQADMALRHQQANNTTAPKPDSILGRVATS